MSSDAQLSSAVDAVRCLYLARVTEQAGHHEAAQRWHAMAAEWIDKMLPSKNGKPTVPHGDQTESGQ